MIDMSQNRVPYGLLTEEEKAVLHEHEKAGGMTKYYTGSEWYENTTTWTRVCVYRTVPLPLTQDEIAWDRLPDWAEWVARDRIGTVHAWTQEPQCGNSNWVSIVPADIRRIDDFPGIIIKRGTCDWKDSKQRRPK